MASTLYRLLFVLVLLCVLSFVELLPSPPSAPTEQGQGRARERRGLGEYNRLRSRVQDRVSSASRSLTIDPPTTTTPLLSPSVIVSTTSTASLSSSSTTSLSSTPTVSLSSTSTASLSSTSTASLSSSFTASLSSTPTASISSTSTVSLSGTSTASSTTSLSSTSTESLSSTPAASISSTSTVSLSSTSTASISSTSTASSTTSLSSTSSPSFSSTPSYSVSPAPSGAPFYYITASSGATLINAMTNTYLYGDDEGDKITLPFEFTFYTERYSVALLSTNGYIEFTLGTGYPITYLVYPLPYASLSATLFPLQLNLLTYNENRQPGDYGIFTGTYGDTPDRIFVVTWRTRLRTQTVFRQNFEVRLFENSTNIDFVYGVIEGLPPEYTIGVQNADRTRYTQYSGEAPTQGTLLRFTLVSP